MNGFASGLIGFMIGSTWVLSIMNFVMLVNLS